MFALMLHDYIVTDKLISVRGNVVKVSTVRPLVVQMSFDCAKCKTSIRCIFPDGKFSPPAICTLHGCKSRTFIPIRSTAQAVDFQKIRLAAHLLVHLYVIGPISENLIKFPFSFIHP